MTIAAVGAVFVLMLLWFLVALAFRRRFQFSLRSLLLLVVVVAIPCSWLATEMKAARRQRDSAKAVDEFGGQVTYDYELDPPYLPPKPPGPAWIYERLGIDMLADVVGLPLWVTGMKLVTPI